MGNVATRGGFRELLKNPGFREVVKSVVLDQISPDHPFGEFSSVGSITDQIDVSKMEEDQRREYFSNWSEIAVATTIFSAALHYGFVAKGNNGYLAPRSLRFKS